MTPAENMYISMKCSVCTISYTVINIDKKNIIYKFEEEKIEVFIPFSLAGRKN